MVQDTLENRIIVYLLDALLAGLIFLVCVWKRTGRQSREGPVSDVAFLCLSSSALARGLFAMSFLGGRSPLALLWLFLSLSALETLFLGSLLVRLVSSPRWKRWLPILMALAASGYVLVQLAVSQGGTVLYEPPYQGGFLHLPIALLLFHRARNTAPQRWNLFQSGVALLIGSYLAESAIDLYSPGAPLWLWNLQHVAKIVALLSFALHVESESSDLSTSFVLRLALSMILAATIFALVLSETLRKDYLEVSANEAQIHLGNPLQGDVAYFYKQGLAPQEIVGHDAVVRRIVSEFTRLPGLKRVTLEVRDRQLLMGIDPDGVISVRTGEWDVADGSKRAYDREDNTVTILQEPVTSEGKPIGALQFDSDLLFSSRRIARGMVLSFSTLLAAALGMLVGGLFYDGYRQMRRAIVLDAQLQQAQKMEAIGRLAGGVAHDFNNLLTVILGYSELVLAQLHKDVPFRSDIGEIKKAGERAARLTYQLLAFSRKQMLQLEVLDLNSVVRNVEAMLRRVIGEDVELVVVTDPALGRVKADAGQMEQVITNLAVNARDAMPQGGRLTLETGNVVLTEGRAGGENIEQPGRYVALTVRDTGCGMDAEVRAHLFEPFFTTKPEGKGTGLGLPSAHGIVKQSGGYIEVNSEPGRGATFTIYLPRIVETETPAASAEASTDATGGSETVLLVEDETPVRTLARHVLRQEGYTVLEANGATEALSLSERYSGPIHLLLVDVVMPGMSGRILADRLASLRPAMKILYMSGYTDEDILQRGIRRATTAFLPKPFTPGVLARTVRDVLGTRAR